MRFLCRPIDSAARRLPWRAGAVLTVAALWMGLDRADATVFSVNPSLTSTSITSETGSLNGTTVQFSINDPGVVQVTVYRRQADNSLTAVTSFEQTFTSGGAKTMGWDGLWFIGDERGRQNGNYQLSVEVSSTSGSASYNIPTPLEINSVDIHNTAVTSSYDANTRPTFPYQIGYALSKAANVTLKIVDSSDTVITTLIDNRLKEGETIATHVAAWNGLNGEGRPVPLGVYYAVFDAVDPNGSGAAYTRRREIAVTSLAGAASDPKRVFEENVYVFPNPIRDSQGIFHFATVRDNAEVTIKIYTVTGDLVRSERFTGLIPGNVTEWTWDATNQQGRKVGRGLYYYVVRHTDPSGTLQTTKKLAVIQ